MEVAGGSLLLREAKNGYICKLLSLYTIRYYVIRVNGIGGDKDAIIY